MTQFHLRSMQLEDSPAISTLTQQGEGIMTTYFEIEAYRAMIEFAEFDTVGVVATVDGFDGLAGIATLRSGMCQYNGALLPFVILDSLKVDERFRKQGLGTQLAQWRVDYARETFGVDVILLSGTTTDNIASQNTMKKWCNEFTDPLQFTLLQTRSKMPKATHGLTIRDATPDEYDALAQAQNTFYADYNPDSGYWKNTKNLDERIFKTVKGELKSHILTVTANYHKQFQLTKNQADFINAKRWYNNYLQHYSAYSHKDNIHYLLGTLLAENNDSINALKHYELSGFDSDIIINKNAAYESILLASKLLQNSQTKQETSIWLNKLINFSTLYSQQYPTDTRTSKVIAYASELAYKNNLFDKTIILSELINTTHDSSLTVNINQIKAHSYFKTGKYVEAENTYLSIFEDKSLTNKAINSIKESLALAIYYQGKSASEKNHLNEAIHHYARIIRVAPDSDIAATGLYDAIALTSQTKQWKQSIRYIESFRSLYPKHKHAHDVSKKLSVAYLNTEQNIAAAQELEQLSKHEKNKEYKVAALLKAGELYESKKDYSSANRSYEQYVKNFPRPFPQYMESMLKLVELNTIKGNQKQVKSWQNKIIKADKKAQSSLKNKRTHYISSVAALELAKDSHIDFSNAKLVLPLNKNLKIKKQAMQKSVNLFAQASSYGDPAIATEATHKIADIYREFSQALLNSERPKHLNKDELEQYKILLEDQAFPFEEKAIEFYEINLVNVKDDIFNQWIEKSHSQLKKLFPVRYARDPKLEEYINVLH